MEYLIGALIAVGFFIVLSLCIYIGYRLGNKKTVPPPIDDEQRKKIERLKNDFSNVLSYDENKARARKQVT